VRRWPPLTLARGRAEFVELTRSLPDDQKTGGVRQDIAREHISYAVSGASITIVSVSLFGFEMSDTEDSNYLEMVARAALHRLAGTRTITENALPSSFRFADEPKPRRATPQTSFENPFGVQGFLRCDSTRDRSDRPLPVGMLAVQGEGDRQLTLYPDETTARIATQELRAELTSCARWRVKPVENIPGAQLAFRPYNEPPGTVVLAIAQWGNSVFIGTEGHRQRLAEAEVVRRAQDALTANRPVVCRVAEGCP
jgi:hypothetical protein